MSVTERHRRGLDHHADQRLGAGRAQHHAAVCAELVLHRAHGLPPRRGVRQPAAVWEAVRAVEQELGADGRVVLRASGTEPLVRVMVEAATVELCDAHCHALVEIVRRELGLADEETVGIVA